jgi:arabinose-5-phosphate isomerase
MNLETTPSNKEIPNRDTSRGPSARPARTSKEAAIRASKDQWLGQVKEVLRLEGESILKMLPFVDDSFLEALILLADCPGKVVITGIGKSGLIARKIAATLSSTGTSASFLHPADAMHGDLGLLSDGDVVIAIGKSGESEELVRLIPALKRMKAKIIGITSRLDSTLARESNVTLFCPVDKEACPLDLAPTSSTTLALAVGDALSMALMNIKNFRSEDFARYHPGGKLGKRLLTKVADLLIPLAKCPTLNTHTATMEDVVLALCEYRTGIALFIDPVSQRLDGILTDGDIRNLVNRHRAKLLEVSPRDVLTKNPFTLTPEMMAIEALTFMESRTQPLNAAPVLDPAGKVLGVIRIHDLLAVS